MTKLTETQKSVIMKKINDGIGYQFETYTYEDMLNDLQLNKQEKKWAMENVGIKAYEFNPKTFVPKGEMLLNEALEALSGCARHFKKGM